MKTANLAEVIANAWDRAMTLAAYGHDPLTVGWFQNEAHVRLWNYRTGEMEWRRYPSRDGQQPAVLPKFDAFASSAWFYEKLSGK